MKEPVSCPRCGGEPVWFCWRCERRTDDVDDGAEELGSGVGSDPRPESEIRRDVVAWLRLVGYEVWDTEQGWRADGSSRVTKGLPDLVVAGHGRTLMVELKSATGKLTPEQRGFAIAWTMHGGNHAVWRSLDDARRWHETREAA